jgi:hypothetical protein
MAETTTAIFLPFLNSTAVAIARFLILSPSDKLVPPIFRISL